MKKTKMLYQNPGVKIESRVKDLLKRMTLAEKVSQLGSHYAETLIENGKFSFRKAKKLLKHGTGQVTRIGGSSRLKLTPSQAAAAANSLQKFLKEETRLGIPAIVHEECLAGLMSNGAVMFPQAIGLGSTWDPELIEEIAGVLGSQVFMIGARQGLAPVLDVVREPRWGRVEETLGEDPYLVAKLACAYVRGLQGKGFRNKVAATLKHFAGHGCSEGGRNSAPAHLNWREMRETFLFPFEAAVKTAGAASVMNAYHEIDGIPCGASKELLTEILRNEWKFDGIVVSDYSAIEQFETFQYIARDKKEAAVTGLEAGLDIELPENLYFGKPLIEAVRKGLVRESFVDRAAARVLRMKFLLGLFDQPYVNENIPAGVFDTAGHRQLALRSASESIVLLKNSGNILPLPAKTRRIAVIGPNANSPKKMLGDYHYPLHIRKGQKGIKLENTIPSIYESIRDRFSKTPTEVVYAKGCDSGGSNKSGFNSALKAARRSDVIIAVLGEYTGIFGTGFSGEDNDRVQIVLPGVQEELLDKLAATGKPVVLVLLNGRPLAIPGAAKKCSAIIEAWYPGEEGGNAITGILFGDFNPSGRLPISFPADTGQIPVHYSRKRSSLRHYVEMESKALFPFGHGLSYTSFKYSGLKIHRAHPERTEISFSLKNTGKTRGDEVAQLYIRDEIGSVARPVLELKGFRRITLEPGESKKVSFTLHSEQLAFYGTDMKLRIEEGLYKVFIGSSSADIRLEGEFTIKENRIIKERKVFFSEIS